MLVGEGGFDLHFRRGENRGVAAIELAANNSPVDCCIKMGSNPPSQTPKPEKTPSKRMVFFPVGEGGFDLHFRRGENRGVAAIELAANNSPVDCCIKWVRIHPPKHRNQKKAPPKRMVFFPVGEGGFDLHFRRGENRGDAAVQPAANNSPLDCCIKMGSNPPSQMPKPTKSTTQTDDAFCWWGKVDSNHRSDKQQIYSLSPLATREFPHIQFVL